MELHFLIKSYRKLNILTVYDIKFTMCENYVEGCDSFYFLGIGGVSMSALALLLKHMGKRVQGCDREQGDCTERLNKEGVDVLIGSFDPNFGGCDAIVYTDAVDDSDRSRACAMRTGKILLSRGELLKAVSDRFAVKIAIAGSHGKSTCTAMTAHIFMSAKRKLACHVGALDRAFGNEYMDGNDYFITEACEYRRNLLWLKPDIAVVLNTEPDHMDTYGDEQHLLNTYSEFCRKSGKSIKLYGELGDVSAVTFGFDARADFHAAAVKGIRGKYSFRLYERDKCLGDVSLGVYGKHNVLNALAASSVARMCGISFNEIRDGLSRFCGMARRFENIGSINGTPAIADYAHHPGEIKAAIKTARQLTDGKLYVIFQPHTYSRTRTLFSQFVNVLSNVDKLLIYRTYAAREYFDDAGSALTLSRAIRRSVYADSSEQICSFISGADKGDLVLILGAGDIYYIARSLVDR